MLANENFVPLLEVAALQHFSDVSFFARLQKQPVVVNR